MSKVVLILRAVPEILLALAGLLSLRRRKPKAPKVEKVIPKEPEKQ